MKAPVSFGVIFSTLEIPMNWFLCFLRKGRGMVGHSDSREGEREAHLHRESRACTSSFADYQMSSKHISKGVILYNFKSSKGLANCCLMLTNLAVTSILVVKRVKDN